MENKYINRYRTFCKCIDNLKKSKNANPSERFRKTLQRVGEEDFRKQLKEAYEGQ